MMPDVLVRNLPQEVVDELKRRAKEKGISLQKELVEVLSREARAQRANAVETARRLRESLRAYGPHTDSTILICEDRGR